jgi:hypothetical protein
MRRGHINFIASAMVVLFGLASFDAMAQGLPSQPSQPDDDREQTYDPGAEDPQDQATTAPDTRTEDAHRPSDLEASNVSEDPRIRVAHVPISQLPAGQSFVISVRVRNDWTASRIWVGVRPIGSKRPFQEMDLRRDAQNLHSAVVAAHLSQPPGLEYYLASQNLDGSVQYHFASPQQPHPLLIDGETAEHRQDQRLARHGGKRTALSVSGDYVGFGSRLHDNSRGLRFDIDDARPTEPFSENFWHLEVEYLYRQLRTLYDIHFGIGFMRGSHGIYQSDRASIADGKPGTNYGYGGATLELASAFSIQGRLAFGASAKGFTMGLGGLMRIGQIGGTNLELGYDIIGDVGSRTRVHFSWDTVPMVPMALGIEITGWPDYEVNPRGSRLYYDLGLNLNQALILTGRFGFVNRANGVTPGYTAGLHTVYQF